MSMFFCHRCDELRDSDDGCDTDPNDDLELICVECMEAAEAAAEEADDRRRDNPLEPDFRRLGQ